MLKRILSSKINELAKQYPVLTLLGPRQAGKTTLTRQCFPDKAYVNLEAPDTLARLQADPRQFFDAHPDGAIIDEIQRLPALLSYIQEIVDEQQKAGQFILTGSHQLALQDSLAQSLAGRNALLDLLPLSLAELASNEICLTTDEQLIKGGLPRIFVENLDPTMAYRNYVRTYVERDVRQIVQVNDLDRFQRFIRLAASRVGSLLNIDSLSSELGVAHSTISNWFSVLKASHLIFNLSPYFENFGKRIIKSPKLYFTDVGLVSYLLGIENMQQMSRDPLRGLLFENLVVLELLKVRFNQGLESNIYFYRDNHQKEVDIIIKYGHQLIPIEIKSTMTFNSGLLKNIKFYQKLAGERAPKGFLVYAGAEEQWIDNIYLINYQNVDKIYELI